MKRRFGFTLIPAILSKFPFRTWGHETLFPAELDMADLRTSDRRLSEDGPLGPEELQKIDTYWRESLYLCVGMIYIQSNLLLKEPLKMEHIKKRLLGHWGSDPGQCSSGSI